MIFGTNNTERMRITSAGYVGIGYTNPSTYLAVNGGVAIGGTSTLSAARLSVYQNTADAYGIVIQASSGDRWLRMGNDGTNAIIEATYNSSSGNGPLTFLTGGSERMRIDASGNFMVGTTSVAAKISFFNSGGGSGTLQVTNTAGTITVPIIQSSGYAAGATTWYQFVGQSGNGSVVTANEVFIYGNGNIVNVNNSYGVMSDAKLKSNVVPVQSQWNDVKALGQAMSKFTLNKDPEQKVHIGWIAQDVQKISAGLVFEHNDFDPSTKELTGETTLGINTSIAQLKAFKALSEAMIRIEQLEARLQAAGIA
jgi:hypothetical protein